MPLLELGGFRAWITSDGRRVDQFQADHDHDNNTVSCFIPGNAGANFVVHWRCMEPSHASSGHVLVDGKDVSSGIIREGNFGPIKREGVKTKDGRILPFKFAQLNLTDDETIADPKDSSLADIGSIELQLTWVRLGSATNFQGYNAEARGPVHEKSKKMGAIHTAFGAGKQAAKTRAITTAPLDPEFPGPHVRFIFRYRTLEMLQAIGIAPMPTKKRANDDEDEEESADAIMVDQSGTQASHNDGEHRPGSRESSPAAGPSSSKRRRLSSEAETELDSNGDVDDEASSKNGNPNPSSSRVKDESQIRKAVKPLFLDEDADNVEQQGNEDDEDSDSHPKREANNGPSKKRVIDSETDDDDDEPQASSIKKAKPVGKKSNFFEDDDDE